MISLCINTHIQVSHMMLYYTTMTVQSQCMGLGLNTLKKLRREDLFFYSCCRVLRFFTAIGSNYVTCNNVYELFVGIERVCQHTVKRKCYANYNFNGSHYFHVVSCPLSHDPPRGWGCLVQGESRSTSCTAA